MLNVLNGEIIAKLIVIFAFLMSYGFVCHSMASDEKSLRQISFARLEKIENISAMILDHEETQPDQTF